MISRHPHRRGSILILFCAVIVAGFALTLLVGQVGRGVYEAMRLQAVADASLLSALRVRDEGLEKIAERWDSIGRFIIGADPSGATVPSSEWTSFETAAKQLSNAIPGYKGRVSSVVTAVAEANGFARDGLQITDAAALNLGITVRPVRIRDESGNSKTVSGVSYERTWSPDDRLADPSDTAVVEAAADIDVWRLSSAAGERWNLRRFSTGRLRWDADLANPSVQTAGNGGFPRSWSEAVVGSRPEPFRYPLFSGILIPGGDLR